MPAPDIYITILVRLEHLQNLFFITRLLVQWGHDSNAELLSVSFEMVSVTLVFWTHMDRLAGLHGDFEWLVSNANRHCKPLCCHYSSHH